MFTNVSVFGLSMFAGTVEVHTDKQLVSERWW